MVTMRGDSGLLDFKSEAEMKDYMDNLGLRFEFECVKERNPISCHSLAQWYETYKHSPKQCADVLQGNCFDLKFGDSCFKYGVFKLLGKHEVTRDPLSAFQAFEHGCRAANHGNCCQAAGRLIAEGIASHSPTLLAATPLFERGCQLGLGESCFHLGGASITMAHRLETAKADASISETPASLRTKALHAWTEGCKHGHELSCRNVARMYSIGDGVPMEKAKADEFLQRAEQLSSSSGEADVSSQAS